MFLVLLKVTWCVRGHSEARVIKMRLPVNLAIRMRNTSLNIFNTFTVQPIYGSVKSWMGKIGKIYSNIYSELHIWHFRMGHWNKQLWHQWMLSAKFSQTYAGTYWEVAPPWQWPCDTVQTRLTGEGGQPSSPWSEYSATYMQRQLDMIRQEFS